MFYPTWVDVAIFIGSLGLFFTLFLLFLRVLPAIAMAEVKLLLKGSSEQSKRKMIKEGHAHIPAGFENSIVIATTATIKNDKKDE